MKNCKNCNSVRIVSVSAKCSDLCFFETIGFESDGYVPSNFGIGGGDYVEFDYCLECGQIQGEFPIKFEPKPMKYCSDCNNKIYDYDDDNCCTSCGSSFDEDDADDLNINSYPTEPIEFEEW